MSLKKGQLGEKIAADYLVKNGYHIKSMNFHSRYGEIDIIAKDPRDVLVFVEVKTYKPNSLVTPLQAIHGKKLHKLMRTIRIYLYRNKIQDTDLRVDAIVVENNVVVNHIQNITA